MKKRYKVLLGLFCLLVALCLGLQLDDDLSPEAVALIEQVDWHSPSEAFVYHLGMEAELGADPMVVGQEVLAEIRQLEASYATLTSFDELPSLSERDALELGDYRAFCSLRDDKGCLAQLFGDPDIPLASPEMIAAKERYLKFLDFGDYRTLTEPHYLEHFGEFSAWTKGNRLVSLEAIALAKAGNPVLASTKLYEVLALQRRLVAQTDTLIARMVSYVLLNETIDVLAVIHREFGVPGRAIKPLATDELSLHAVLAHEFMFARSGFDMISLDSEFNEYSAWPNWVLQIGLKPNITLNELVPHYLQAIEVSEMTPPRFDSDNHMVVNRSRLRNYLGSKIFIEAKPDFNSYIARGFDLNVKITLFNGLINNEINDATLGGIENPYYGNEFNATLSEDGKRVCMGGPLEDLRGFRCLAVKF